MDLLGMDILCLNSNSELSRNDWYRKYTVGPRETNLPPDVVPRIL